MKFEDDFKEAISRLPSKEKDKLIHRLLRRDKILAKKLEFELLSKVSVDEKRNAMENTIIAKAIEMTKHFYTPSKLTIDLRRLSSEITLHVKITNDKFGEASLNLLMLNEVLDRNSANISSFTQDKVAKLCVYAITRAFRILILIEKLDEDYFIELQEGLIKLGNTIVENQHMMRSAIQNGFDVNWLISAQIPEDIGDQFKTIKSRGFL